MRESSKAALGGIVSALALTVMLITYFSPFLVYTAPPFAGILLLIIVNEINYKWAFGTYAAISLLSIFLIADKEAAVFFVMFFGYYPILKMIIDSKIKLKVLRAIIKVLLYNGSLFLAILICMYVFSISYDDIGESGIIMTVLFVLLCNLLFVIYEFLLNRVQILYIQKLKGLFSRIFRH